MWVRVCAVGKAAAFFCLFVLTVLTLEGDRWEPATVGRGASTIFRSLYDPLKPPPVCTLDVTRLTVVDRKRIHALVVLPEDCQKFYLPLAYPGDSWDVLHPGEDENTQSLWGKKGLVSLLCSLWSPGWSLLFWWCPVRHECSPQSALGPAGGDQVPLPGVSSTPTSSDSTYTAIKAIRPQLSACTRKIFIWNLQYSKLCQTYRFKGC